jgi:hypothetical protein
MTAVFCIIAAASATVSGAEVPELAGAATIAVTSEAATTVNGRNSLTILGIDPPRRAPEQDDEKAVDDEEGNTERDLRAERR